MNRDDNWSAQGTAIQCNGSTTDGSRGQPRAVVQLLSIIALAITSGACGGGGGFGFPSFDVGDIQPFTPSSNRAPKLDPVADQTVRTDTDSKLTVTATDPEGDKIVFSLSNTRSLPDFVTIDRTSKRTAVITFTPGYDDEGFYPIWIRASDKSDSLINFDYESFWLVVRAAPNPARSFYRLPIPVRETPKPDTLGLGWSHSCMTEDTAEDASLVATWCWGDNERGQLGFESSCANADSGCADTARRVDLAVPLVSVAGSTNHSCGLTANGEAWCWGLGHGGSVPMAMQTDLRFVELDVSLGNAQTCGRTEQGYLYCWQPEDTTPKPVADGFSFQTFDLGGDFSCGVDHDLRTFCWGNNWSGQLGTGNVGQTDGPAYSETPVEVVGGHQFTHLALGLSHACGLTGNGVVWCWGHIVSRTGVEFLSGTPQELATDKRFRQIVSGGSFSCGIYQESNAPTVCWGDIDAGPVVTDANFVDPLAPVLVDPIIMPRSIAAGGGHVCGTANGGVYCWGDNSHGQLGRLPGTSR